MENISEMSYCEFLEWRKRRKFENRRKREQRMEEARARGTHTKEEWEDLKEEFGQRCVCCGADEPLAKDHIVPIYAGGSDAISNLQPLCSSCNSSKGPDDFNWVEHRRSTR